MDDIKLEQDDVSTFFQNPDLEAFKGVTTLQKAMTEEELFDILCNEVADMMEHRMEYLLSLMYRLDVLEKDIDKVLTPLYDGPVNVGLARLILNRQKQKILTKKSYVPPIIEEGWEW